MIGGKDGIADLHVAGELIHLNHQADDLVPDFVESEGSSVSLLRFLRTHIEEVEVG